ncbi:sigma-54 interaction domain-containing protein [Clostridium hydrogeniformans]|uniref:sigma-54 interaction domain-containing protein n=1 Tax=Clostridium hydrogeniformans TaxID=349933 RepID=UPI00048890E5|nr:sigma 54-interacting transcriptional regulator [Clostridium hydrogeniformans]
MEKTLALISNALETANVYCEQIESLFENNVRVNKYIINDNAIKDNLKEDLILIPSYDVFQRIKSNISSSSQVLFYKRTISKEGLKTLANLEKDTEIIFVDENIDMATAMTSIIYEVGLRRLNIIPVSLEESKTLENKIIVTLSHLKSNIIKRNRVINIGSSFLDGITIINIGFRLNLDHIIARKDIRRNYKDFVPANIGLQRVLTKLNKFNGQLEELLKVIDDGVIVIDPKGHVLSYTEGAQEIMKVSDEEAYSRNGIEVFSDIPFLEVIKTRKEIKDRLIKIHNHDVIMSVIPIINSKRPYGAVAIIKKFSEAELKQHKLRVALIGRGYKAKYSFNNIIGESEVIKKAKDDALKMAKSNSTIVITGESGTGKELFAQAIHNSSKRREYQFVAVNCGALPESLLESELFGYEDGAFTGARKGGKPGLFELAHRGTLFLDEIGEMSLNIQARLLRVLQEREVMRIGGDRMINVDIRLIAATHKDLLDMVDKGEFREDLYYRLNVLKLHVPRLNHRKDDIMLLIEKFKREFRFDFKLSDEAKTAFLEHNWRGNIRELRNYIEHITSLEISEVSVADLPFNVDKSFRDYKKEKNKNLYEDRNREIYEDEDKELFNNIAKSLGKHFNRHILVLEELKEGFYKNKRLGRRSILEGLNNKNVFITEQEIRGILGSLEEYGIVEIFKGRGGTLITEFGISFLDYMENR